jgi:hypothetical protein
MGAVYEPMHVTVSGNSQLHTASTASSAEICTAKESRTYHWVALYSGDSNTKGVTTGRGTEPARVAAVAPLALVTPIRVPVTG